MASLEAAKPGCILVGVELDFALVRFEGEGSATDAFVAARDRSRADEPWTREVGFVEHHHNGHLVLRGTFAGHYVDVDEALHVSEEGTAEGFAGGALIGALLGPAGIAAGMIAGATIGSQVGQPSEADPEPQALVDLVRTAVPRSSSAIVLISAPRDVDGMLTAIGAGDVIRQTLTADQTASIQASLSATPTASLGPSVEGEQAVEASESRNA
jgi:uncharacterized membrane protein